LIKNAEALESLEKVDTLVLDKTGTLTEGKPRLTAITSGAGVDPNELLRMAASLERASEHPLAHAVITAAQERGLHLAVVNDVQSHAGKGISGKVEGQDVVIGTFALLHEHGVEDKAISVLHPAGASLIYIGIDGKYAGCIAVSDPVKAAAAAAIRELQNSGLRTVMLTGDNKSVAESVSTQLGIDEFKAEVLPQDKSQIVKDLQSQGLTVAMAGDGINDAPALAQANVGIAMGTGTDVAIESAGITLVKGDLAGIIRARKLSRAVMKNIRQNLFFAFIYNSIGVPIAAGVLYPFFGVLLSPILAAAAMSFSSVSVITNSLRLRNVKL
ncbi:MAG TPA: heavy metal translocating P-type ATPase, partial [Terriglobales bacterium]|nr:heavy metal translocating P-type ATPase [Terriglobales bacterium]